MDCDADEDIVLHSVYLTTPLDSRLRARAFRLGKTSGDLIREILRSALQEDTPVQVEGEAARSVRVIEPKSKQEIAASIEGDRIVSFLNGKSYKNLARHIQLLGMSPEDYRVRFNLPKNYPMAARSIPRETARPSPQDPKDEGDDQTGSQGRSPGRRRRDQRRRKGNEAA